MNIAEMDLRHKAACRGFRAHKLDRTGTHWLLYRAEGGTAVIEGTLQSVSDYLDRVLIEAVKALSPEFKRVALEVLGNV